MLVILTNVTNHAPNLVWTKLSAHGNRIINLFPTFRVGRFFSYYGLKILITESFASPVNLRSCLSGPRVMWRPVGSTGGVFAFALGTLGVLALLLGLDG